MEDKIVPYYQMMDYLVHDKIIIDENNSNTIISAGSSGIHRSIDGGQNWSNPSQLQTYDIHFKSDDASTVYAIATLNGYFKFLISTNGGQDLQNPIHSLTT